MRARYAAALTVVAMPVVWIVVGGRESGRPDTVAPRLELSIHPAPDRWLRAIDGPAYAAISDVAISPDGRAVAAASTDGVVRIWDLVSGKLLLTISGHTDQVLTLAYAPDGRSLATGQKGGEVRVWEVAGGRLLLTVQAAASRPGTVRPVDLAYSPDGSQLAASLGRDSPEGGPMWGEMTILTIKGDVRPRVVSPPKSHRGGTACFAADGKSLGFVCNGHLRLIDPGTAREVGLMEAPVGRNVTTAVSLSADGKQAAAAVMWSAHKNDGPPYQHEVSVWDVATRRPAASLAGHTDQIISTAFLPAGETLVSASWDGTVRFWDVRSAAELLVIPALPGPPDTRVKLSDDGMIPIAAAALSADGSILAAAYRDGVVRVWDTKSLLTAAKK